MMPLTPAYTGADEDVLTFEAGGFVRLEAEDKRRRGRAIFDSPQWPAGASPEMQGGYFRLAVSQALFQPLSY